MVLLLSFSVRITSLLRAAVIEERFLSDFPLSPEKKKEKRENEKVLPASGDFNLTEGKK